MNIAIVTNNFDPITSGISVSINSLYQGLKDLGHKVYIFAPKYPHYNDTNPDIQRTFSLKLYYKEKYPIPLISSHRLSKLMRKLSIDIIHSHHPFGIGKTALSVAEKLKIPIVFTYHTMYEHYSHYIPIPDNVYLKKYLINAALKYSNKCDLIITPTMFMRELLLERGCKKPIEILPTGISQEIVAFNDSLKCLEIRQKYQLTKDDIVLLCVSRLAQEKNIEFLMKSFALVVERLPKAKLLIVGSGYLEHKIRKNYGTKEFNRNVIFVSSVPHAEIAAFYMIARVLLFVSKTETQGLPLFETLHFGLPIIAVESFASKEMVDKLKLGIMTTNDPTDFANSIISLSKDQKMIDKYKNNNQQIAMQFRMDNLINHFESLYNNLRLKSFCGAS